MLLRVFPAVAVLTLLQEPIFQRLQSFCSFGWLPSLSLGCCFFEVGDKVPRSEVILESQASREFELQLSLSRGLARVVFLLPCLSLCLNSCSLLFSSFFIVFPFLVLLSLPAVRSLQKFALLQSPCPCPLVGLHPLSRDQNCPDPCADPCVTKWAFSPLSAPAKHFPMVSCLYSYSVVKAVGVGFFFNQICASA